MITLRKPTPRAVRDLLDGQRDRAYSYFEVGETRDGRPDGYDNDRTRRRIGHGPEQFARARSALARWEMVPEWVAIAPLGTRIEPDAQVALSIRALGLWWTSASRVVYVVDEPQRHRYGFAYGTLPHHVERGEELFLVDMDDAGVVWYEIRAFSKPRHPLVRAGYPVARRLQRRFVRDSGRVMARRARGLP